MVLIHRKPLLSLIAALCLSLAAQASTLSTTYTRVEEMTGWLTCGACGNTGGTGSIAQYSMTRGITTPSMDGSSSKFAIGGSTPYTNGYWYYRHTAISKGITYLAYDFYIYVPSGSLNAPQAIEFECQQRVNGWVYNFAWQAEYPNNQWRIFNYVKKTWENSGLSLTRFSTGKWHHIIAEYHTNTSTHTVYHDALTVDGVRRTLTHLDPAKYTGNMTNEFTNAFQLDLNSTATDYHVYVDNMKITAKYPQ